MTAYGRISTNFPAEVLLFTPPAATTGFSVTAEGTGSFTGLSYTIPAHASGSIKAKIQVKALTSQDVEDLNKLVMGMLSASEQSKVTAYEKIHASGNISLWSMFGGGASASYDTTNKAMQSMGLSDVQITTIIDAMMAAAQKMSNVQLDFNIDNTANDYAISGDLQLYTIAGEIKTDKGTAQYRLLSNKGRAGGGAAPAEGKIIPLS